jgi:serine/threonine protein kinase
MRDYLNKQKEKEEQITEADVIRWFIQMLMGLQHIHGNLIVHRDLKPENIMITNDNNVIIIDMGLAKKFDIDTTTSK